MIADAMTIEAELVAAEQRAAELRNAAHNAQRQAFENRDRQWRQRICEAQREYEAAAAAETTRRSEFSRNEIHREIERLTRQRDAALAALSSPIE